LADQNGFFVDGDVYLGRQNGQPAENNQGYRVVMQLCQRYYQTGRNVTMDNFFTNIPLAKELLCNGLTLVGTLRKNKPEVPSVFISQRPHLTSLFGYSGGLQLTSYMAKKTKCVLLLSTMHNSNDIDVEESLKPLSILDYNTTKCFVDVNNQMVNTFSTRRKIRRWPMTVFFHILDLCAVNAYITWIKRNPTWEINQKEHRRTIYLKALALSMMRPWMINRSQTQSFGANQPRVKRALEICGVTVSTNIIGQETNDGTDRIRSRCCICTTNRRIFSRCVRCRRHVCNEHSVILCEECKRE
jgi:hypothetical protein